MKGKFTLAEAFFIGILLSAFIVALVGAFSAVFMVAWNVLIPPLFHGPAITYIQSIAACVLLIIIGGFIRAKQ